MTNLIEAGRVFENGFKVKPVEIDGKAVNVDTNEINLADHDFSWIKMKLTDGVGGRSFEWYQFGHSLANKQHCIEVSIDPELITDGQLPSEIINNYHGSGYRASSVQIVDYNGKKVAKATLSRTF